MNKLQSNNPYDDQHDGDKPDYVIGVSKKENTTKNCSGSANPGPNAVGCSYGDHFHGLGYGKKAKHNKNNGEDTWKDFSKSLTVF